MPPRGGGPPPGEVNLPPGTYGVVRDASGSTVAGPFVASYGQEAPDPPALPDDLTPGQAVTVDAQGGGEPRYRVEATPLRGGTGSVVVAVPLGDVDATLDRLLAVLALVIVGVLLVLGVAAAWLVRLGLRPLDRMGTTAGIIAGGDLSRRVDPATSRTEVGRLGLALNAMLDRLEVAFAQKQESEERLRRFLSDASHELRTPLASIRGYAELFRMGATRTPEEVDRAMRRIEEEAARMGLLVEDLLALARLDELRDPVRTPVDLARDRARRGRRRAGDRARAPLRARRGARRHGARRSRRAAPGARQPAPQRGRPHAARHTRRRRRRAARRRRPDPRPRPRAGTPDGGSRRAVRPLLARRARDASAGRPAPASGSRSWPGSSRRTMAACTPRTPPTAARASPCCCPPRRRSPPVWAAERPRR